MTIYTLADLMTCLIESIFMFMLYDAFCAKRENLPFYIYYVGVLVLAILINISNVVFDYGIMNSVGMTICFFVVSFLYIGNIKTRAIISVMYFLILAIIETMVLYGIVLIFKISVSFAVEDIKYRLLGIIVSKMLTFFVINIIRLKFKNKHITYGASYWVLFFVMFSISIITVFIIFKLSYNMEENYLYVLSVLCSFGLLFSTLFALFLYEHLTKQTEVINKQRQYEQQLKSQIKHVDEILVNQKQLKKFRHDFLNFIIGLKGYIESKDYEKASTYINSLSNELSSGNYIIETGNAALDAVLSTKKRWQKARI